MPRLILIADNTRRPVALIRVGRDPAGVTRLLRQDGFRGADEIVERVLAGEVVQLVPEADLTSYRYLKRRYARVGAAVG